MQSFNHSGGVEAAYAKGLCRMDFAAHRWDAMRDLADTETADRSGIDHDLHFMLPVDDRATVSTSSLAM